jgi:gas vesicle protein
MLGFFIGVAIGATLMAITLVLLIGTSSNEQRATWDSDDE